ncbi:dienelactone hydrolase [Xylariales sp. AK1849]|nr:dienelactone hydrolase [Xylariales sp. AK1849]
MRALSSTLALVRLSTLGAAHKGVAPGLGHVAANSTKCPVDDVSVIAHTGTPVGREEVHGGVNLYITGTGNSSDTAVLYLTDVFGINLAENKLLADSFGRAGFLTVAPDLFNGTPSPIDMNEPGFNITEFLAAHGPNTTDPLIDVAVKYLKETAGVTKIGATGYCFGGRYAFRFVAEGRGADAAFAAHPSLLEDGEITAISGPTSMAAAENDTTMPSERRHNITTLLGETGLPYSVALYSGTTHGFGVRANISDPEQKFGKESAFFQAVRWFENWL